MFAAMNSNRQKMGKAAGAAAAEVFLESDDWQTLLAQKFEIQEAQAAKQEE